jgi:hypothetical protein
MATSSRQIGWFYAAVFVATHVITTVYRLRGGVWSSLDVFVLSNGIMLVPGLTALLFARWVFRQPVASALGLRVRPNRWWPPPRSSRRP